MIPFLFPFSRGLLFPLVALDKISFSVISHEPGIVGISILGDGSFLFSLRIPTLVSLVFPYQIGISHVLYLSLLLLS